MRVFISWSGERSRALAEILRDWLPSVIQAIKPYFSPDDTAKGSVWFSEVARQLEDTRIGLICLTPDNLTAPWLLFEAGAISKDVGKSRVIPILFGLEPTDLQGPLVQFQAAPFTATDFWRVIKSINSQLNEPLSIDILRRTYDTWWPKLEQPVTDVLAKTTSADTEVRRTERELLEEILQLVRAYVVRPEPQTATRLVELEANLAFARQTGTVRANHAIIKHNIEREMVKLQDRPQILRLLKELLIELDVARQHEDIGQAVIKLVDDEDSSD